MSSHIRSVITVTQFPADPRVWSILSHCWTSSVNDVRFWQQWRGTINIKQPRTNYTYVFYVFMFFWKSKNMTFYVFWVVAHVLSNTTLGYPCAKFRFRRPPHAELTRGEKSDTQSLTQSLTQLNRYAGNWSLSHRDDILPVCRFLSWAGWSIRISWSKCCLSVCLSVSRWQIVTAAHRDL